MNMTFELCIDSLDQAYAAKSFGARRVELCSALQLGGLSPTIGMTRQCSDLSGIETHVMIRPRGGGFLYSKEEILGMRFDIQALQQSGARGVVFGILNQDRSVDAENNSELLDLAKSLGLEVTFHRAFDFVTDPQSSLDHLIRVGFDRVLTSGQQSTAIEGIELIKKLVKQSQGKIEIMAGSGIDSSNVLELQATGLMRSISPQENQNQKAGIWIWVRNLKWITIRSIQ